MHLGDGGKLAKGLAAAGLRAQRPHAFDDHGRRGFDGHVGHLYDEKGYQYIANASVTPKHSTTAHRLLHERRTERRMHDLRRGGRRLVQRGDGLPQHLLPFLVLGRQEKPFQLYW
jgi:hypothetical protein